MTHDAALSFVAAFAAVQQHAHQVNRDNGWWDKRDRIREILSREGIDNAPSVVIELLGLADSEHAEGMEAARKHPKATWGDYKTKDTLVRELAGAIVRDMDIAAAFGLPLAEAILEEIRANASRGYMHGGKAA